MLEKNKEQLEVLENEAIDFVNHIYKRYKGKVSAFVFPLVLVRIRKSY